mmetsp:Transcript_54777/g.94465  ORF Transcript_54777/g.94465 Transcript_54777/m.94465 type:complete len:251 (+) Transcript_54777:3-755(+)
MICCAPHGAYAFSGILFVGPQLRLGLSPELKNHPVFYGVASVLFYVPLIREIVLFIGCREVTQDNVSKIVKNKFSVAMIPGGIYEQVQTRHDQERCYVMKKLGFIRLAIQLGVDIVPMYGFGENQLFTIHSFGQAFRLALLKKLRVGLPLVSGRFGLVPHAIEIVHVYGRPIKVGEACAKPTDAQVEEVYKKYVAEFTRLFKDHATRLLPKEVAAKGLEVVRVGVDFDDRADFPSSSSKSLPSGVSKKVQ